MIIQNGGQVKKLETKLHSISIDVTEETAKTRIFDVWLIDTEGNRSLSYLTVVELLDLKDEITDALKSLL